MKTDRLLLVLVILALAGLAWGKEPPAASPEGIEFFEKKVRPLLAANCYSCHGPEKQKAGLRLDSREGFLKGGESGPVVAGGKPEESRLIKAVRYDDDELRMPPSKKLPGDAIETLTAWVRIGAPWPEEVRSAAGGKSSPAAAAASHWAFQPVRPVAVPELAGENWPANPLDRFILEKLKAASVRPAPPADRRTLIRRLTFALHGLPPTLEEIDAFVKDASPDAYEKLLDRLLASPRYGERWGRHWLDIARYANERGYVGVGVDRVYPFAYAYRDWVIQALNEDLPYDRFLILQLAADQKPFGDDPRHLAAMGFLTVGRRFINNQHDIIDDRIDVVCRGMMGLTVTCARCHDHKYDPIPMADYYSLYGVFASSREPADLPLLDETPEGPEYEAFQAELMKLEAEKAAFEKENETMRKERPREYREKIKPFENKIRRLHAEHPGAPPRGMVLVDSSFPANPRIFLRGNPGTPGPEVPRQFLSLLAGEARKPFDKDHSGRLEMARAIASRDNPLTARVLVNRVWRQHFGRGLVLTPSDFGTRSDPPSHPELLDWLAAWFMDQGWSIKKLHRLVLSSSTYQQSCDGDPRGAALDPENRLLGRMRRQRLDFEALRDAVLFVSGAIDLRMGGQAVKLTTQAASRRRTVYGFIDRQNLPGMYRTFDFANPDTHSPERFTTTVPQQALFLMNSPFMVEQARLLADRPDVSSQPAGEPRIQRLYRLLYGRPARPEEVAAGLEFVNGPPAHGGAGLGPWVEYVQALLLANEFAFVD